MKVYLFTFLSTKNNVVYIKYMKVLFVFNHPAPYKVKYFNELAKYCDLTVIFERKEASDRNKMFYAGNEYNFKHIFLNKKGFGTENHNSNEIIKHLKSHKYDFVIMNGYSTFTEIRTINYMNKMRIKYILYINGGIVKEKESNFKRNLKRKFIGGAQYYFSPNEKSNEYLEFYGADKNKIFNYPYSSIYESEIAPEVVNKEELRLELGLPLDKKIIISCGQFIKRKNFMSLLKAWNVMGEDLALVLIGGGKLEQTYKNYVKRNKLTNVYIYNFQEKSRLLQYFRASDIFIFPSLEDINGHVINEAMSQGLPVISNRNVTSSLKLIETAYNGYFFDPDNVKEMRDCIFNILDKQEAFSRHALKTSKTQTIELMAKKNFEDLKSIYKKPRIVYLTTAESDEDYSFLLKTTYNPPNPSNQNFHSRYISLLSKYYEDISVISLRPFNQSIYYGMDRLKKEIKRFNNVEYNYLEVDNLRTSKLKLSDTIYRLLDSKYVDSRTIILVDPLNIYLSSAALKLKKKYDATVVAFLTDNPKNISNVRRLYVSIHKKLTKKYSGYISLTKELNDLFNVNKNPVIYIEGVSENFKKQESPQVTEYFFFGGALYERYGVTDLIDAFNQIDNKEYIDLVIAGHGPLSKEIESIARSRRHIKFLQTVSKDTMAQYEQHAIACINPRRKDTKLDKESIPSKVVEYASNKSLIISSYNDKIFDMFKENIVYFYNKEELKDVLVGVLKNRDDKKYKKFIDNNYKVVKEKYSEDVIVEKLNVFFLELLRTDKKL